LLRRVPIPGGTLARIPFGNILRAPQRTILTAVGIGAIITVLIGTLGMIDSFFAAGDQSERTLLGHAPDRVLVELDALQPVQSGAYRAVAESPKLSRAEPVTRIVGTLVGDEDSIDVLIDFVDFSSDLWVPDVVEGESVHGGETGVLLTRKAGEDLGIGIGDMVTLRHARRDGGSFSTVETQVPLLGFHGHAFRTFGYMDRGQLAIAGLDGMANQVSANPVEGLSPNDVGRALFDESGVASVQPVLSIATAFNDAIGDFATILYVFVGVGLVITGLISFNSAIISIDERRREHATMFAYGVPVRTIVRISVVQNFVLGLVSTALGLAGGFVFIEWMIGFIVPRSMPDLGLERTLSLQSVAITFLVGTIVVAATPLLAVRRLRRMDIPSTLRVME